MGKYITILIILDCAWNSYAQQGAKFGVTLPDSVSSAAVEWVDMDNDSLLDVLAIAKKNTGEQFLFAYRNNLANSFDFESSKLTGFKNAVYVLADFDLDNQIDIVLSGLLNGQPATTVFLNKGNFDFEMMNQPLVALNGSVFKLADLDQDGKNELIISGDSSGQYFFNIYKERAGVFQLVNDSLKMKATSIQAFDFDGDLDNDFFISGLFLNDSSFNGVFYNQGGFYFKSTQNLSSVQDGRTAMGDINEDGKFDIVLTGRNQAGMDSTLLLMNDGTSFTERDAKISLNTNELFIADMNSDGQADISFWGTNVSGDTLNLIQDSSGKYDTLNSKHLLAQRFGDFNRDGDLDWAQLSQSDSLRLLVYENASPKNLAPLVPINSLLINIFNRIFIYCDPTTDDHTPAAALTYDLTLQTSGTDLISGDFDQINHRRLVVSHGNLGTKNFNLLRGLPQKNLAYFIEPIDNSFHAGYSFHAVGGSGICHGTASPCEIMTEHVSACQYEKISLTASGQALWFSFSTGFLGRFTSLDYIAAATDTVFSFDPNQAQHCGITVYIIDLKTHYTKVTESILTACEGASLNFQTETNWPSVEWSSSVKGFISNSYSIQYLVSVPDTVKVKINTGTTCSILRKTVVQISKPEIKLNGETFQILKGGSVQLNASGGSTYHWQPPTDLSQIDIANPIASPTHTTEYTVQVADSIGCLGSAKVLVVVEETSFIPTLFTPNGDGKNDELKIYGVDVVRNFSFSIHNREGSLVYETKDPSEAENRGWNGTSKNTPQPSGVYYWKVNGELSSGGKFLLNGKTTGSIVLIR